MCTGAFARAREFLRHAQAGDTQDRAFRLLGLIWSGGDAAEIAAARAELAQWQRADGGWADGGRADGGRAGGVRPGAAGGRDG